MTDELIQQIKFIAYFGQFKTKRIFFQFSDSISVKVTKTVVENFKKTNKFSDTHPKVKMLREQMDCYVTYHGDEYEKIEIKTIEAFYNLLWKKNQHNFSSEIDFATFEIKRFKKEFTKSTRDKFLYISIPYLNHLKDKLPSKVDPIRSTHQKQIPDFLSLIPNMTSEKESYVERYSNKTPRGIAALIVALEIGGSMEDKTKAANNYYGLDMRRENIRKHVAKYANATQRTDKTKFNEVNNIKRAISQI